MLHVAQRFLLVRRVGSSCFAGLRICDGRDCRKLALVNFTRQVVWLVGLSLVSGRSG